MTKPRARGARREVCGGSSRTRAYATRGPPSPPGSRRCQRFGASLERNVLLPRRALTPPLTRATNPTSTSNDARRRVRGCTRCAPAGNCCNVMAAPEGASQSRGGRPRVSPCRAAKGVARRGASHGFPWSRAASDAACGGVGGGRGRAALRGMRRGSSGASTVPVGCGDARVQPGRCVGTPQDGVHGPGPGADRPRRLGALRALQRARGGRRSARAGLRVPGATPCALPPPRSAA